MPTKADLERARAWWVQQIGFLAPTDDRKVETLAAEFEAARHEAAREAPGVAALLSSAVETAASARREAPRDATREGETPVLMDSSVAALLALAIEAGAKVSAHLEQAAGDPAGSYLRAAMQSYERTLRARAGASRDDDLECCCALDPRCPIHGGEA